MLSTRLVIIASLAVAQCWTFEEFYDVACPGENMELQCPPGQEIEVLSLHHGLNTSVDCAARSHRAEVSPDKCFHGEMLGWVKFICDKMERCRLPKPHADMFVCDDAEEFFIQTTYICKEKSPDVHTINVCDGHLAKLECENGLLNIVKASYGRFDEHTCTETPSFMTFCSSYHTGPYVKQMCNNERECIFPVSPDYLGRPFHCDKLAKYLRVDYVCE